MTYFYQVEDDLDRIKNASSQQELMSSFKDFGRSLMDLNDTAGRRQGVSIFSTSLFKQKVTRVIAMTILMCDIHVINLKLNLVSIHSGW